MNTNTIIGVGVLLGLCSVIAVLLLRRTSDDQVATFADVYQLDLTPTSVAQLRRLILRSRRFRFVGAVIATAGSALWRGSPSLWGLLGALAVGFAVGSIADELQRPRMRGSGVVAASLDRRTVRTYAERWVLAATTIVVVVAVNQGWTLQQIEPADVAPPDDGWVLRGLAVIIATLAFGAVALRRIVQAPRINEPHELQAVRHAIRMAGVLSVIGAMNVLVGAVALSFATATTLNDNGLATWWQWVNNVSLVAAAAGFYTGIMLSIRAFPQPPLFGRRNTIPFAHESDA